MGKTPGQILWEAEAAFHGVDASHYEFVDDAGRVRLEQFAAAVWNAAIDAAADVHAEQRGRSSPIIEQYIRDLKLSPLQS